MCATVWEGTQPIWPHVNAFWQDGHEYGTISRDSRNGSAMGILLYCLSYGRYIQVNIMLVILITSYVKVPHCAFSILPFTHFANVKCLNEPVTYLRNNLTNLHYTR